ncbi:hypothetical protein RRG08_009925 [Elysia crispata]|uniref:Uncharacterized protein n=1 Tax=Elysia crispata TaxID=231223 RepID=A0AAE1ASK8_9GAST|nr:hypothetical protein RRG08_009925 [Elysia crispata]
MVQEPHLSYQAAYNYYEKHQDYVWGNQLRVIGWSGTFSSSPVGHLKDMQTLEIAYLFVIIILSSSPRCFYHRHRLEAARLKPYTNSKSASVLGIVMSLARRRWEPAELQDVIYETG